MYYSVSFLGISNCRWGVTRSAYMSNLRCGIRYPFISKNTLRIDVAHGSAFNGLKSGRKFCIFFIVTSTKYDSIYMELCSFLFFFRNNDFK